MKNKLILLFASFIFSVTGITGIDPGYFPEIKDWKISEEIQTFNPESLFEYINGAADLFLIYDFQELKVATYVYQLNKNENIEIDVEVYDQKTTVNAYGMYSQERPSRPDFVKLGAQAYKEGAILNFISGNYYVKIDSHDNADNTVKAILLIAQSLSKKLSDSNKLPELLDVFPDEEKTPNSDMYISKDFLGHSFLTDVYRTDYKVKDKKYSLFIIHKESKDACKQIIRSYHDFCQKGYKNIIEGEYKLSDKYNGALILTWRGNYIWGIISRGKIKKASEKLKYIEAALTKIN